MRKLVLATFACLAILVAFQVGAGSVLAQTTRPKATVSPSPTPTPFPTPTPVPPQPDLTEPKEETLGRLEKVLHDQELGSVWPLNPVKYAIRQAVARGVPANTIVLLLLLPVVASFIAGARHLIGLRGFGIFLPAALSIVFMATGPVVGLGLFLIIIAVSMLTRFGLKALKLRLQYLPRMALLLWFVSLAIMALLFGISIFRSPDLANISIFPVLFLVLLAEDFTRVQLGKSVRTAISLTSETLILAFISYFFLTLEPLQEAALLHPESLLLGIAVFDLVLGRYVGLRILEIWRFRKLILS